ncbi:hypothetical protein HH310_09610 [Actinoplanes sp. TBRC 11911]|uniref:hypothetical protein n=1 Tax=Actinoplanes sp. TBRC 11911 TaxID=2729386 RepID=UPI00145C5B50|nr:hypothetical protein [Actinoplanes sp. TBRC 11911]NMO51446.1 hypothetical protein [Actinoplanes sp. TBRC 11911]
MDMEYSAAVWAVTASLAGGEDDDAAPGGIWLALQAWKHLGGSDPVWDRIGPDLLEVRDRLYPDQDVQVQAGSPSDNREARTAVAALLEQLAVYHLSRSAADSPLLMRMAHDASVEQLRDAAAALA